MRKKESKFTRIDVVIVSLCLLGACISGIAFWREYTNTLLRLNEEPVGTIIFQQRVAQRRFVDRLVWDRLRLASPVFNGDTIRTIERSEAIIIFGDEVTRLSLNEHTMIQIFFDTDTGTQVDFIGGNIEMVSEARSFVITSGLSTIVVEGQAVMERNDEGFLLHVSEGQATFDGTEVEAGDILYLDQHGEPNRHPVITMTSLGASAAVLGTAGQAVPVVFAWNSFFFTPDTAVIIEVAADRRFNRIVETRTIEDDISSISIALEQGVYWWRAFPSNAGNREPETRFFPSGTLEVIASAAPSLLLPEQAAQLVFPGGARVHFSWSAVEGAAAYLLEVSASADMESPALSRLVESTSAHSALGYGGWYWRVTPVFPPHIRGLVTPSATGAFSVIRGSVILAAPVLMPETDNHLMWRHDPRAVSWLVELADNPQMTNPVLRQNASSNFVSLPQNVLENAQSWYWRVTALGGETPAVSEIRRFETAAHAPLAVAPAPYVPAAMPALPEVLPHFPPVMFAPDSGGWHALGAETAAVNDRTLLQITEFLQTYRTPRLRIEGHANPVIDPADTYARQREYLEELQPLSDLRAQTVADRLTELGADPARLEARGLGGERPLATWEDTANWHRNRRVEFVWDD